MTTNTNELCSIIVCGRDKFSTCAPTLETLIEHTPEPHEIIVVLGGAPLKTRQDLQHRFGEQVKFIFPEDYLTSPQSRTIGMKEAKGRLAVLMDADVLVRPGWLAALLQVQKETGAVMVMPTVLEDETVIHTAGNQLYVTYKDGKQYGHKCLPFHRKPYHDGANLKRTEIDYGELHCQLVEVEPTLRLNAFDENVMDISEVDSGLIWKKAGLKMVYEPTSVVYYLRDAPIAVEDIKYFIWRWDLKRILKGYEYFDKKWDLDISESGGIRNFFLNFNKKLGIWARWFPNEFGLFMDRVVPKLTQIRRLPRVCLAPWRRYLAHRLGYDAWNNYVLHKGQKKVAIHGGS